MHMDEQKKVADYKYLGVGGVGGATLVGLLMSFQNQGIDLISKNQVAQNQVVIEKTIANSTRINKLETNVQALNDKIDRGFDSVRAQLRDETSKISDIIRISAGDRYTKTEQTSYQNAIEVRLQRIEDDVKALGKEKK